MIFKGNTKMTPALTELLDDTTSSPSKTYSSNKIETLIGGGGSSITLIAETTNSANLMSILNTSFTIGADFNNREIKKTIPHSYFNKLVSDDELLTYKYLIYELENIGGKTNFLSNTSLGANNTFSAIYSFSQEIERYVGTSTLDKTVKGIKNNISYQFINTTGVRTVYIGGQNNNYFGNAIADKITENDLSKNSYFTLHLIVRTLYTGGNDATKVFNGTCSLANENSKIKIYGVK